MPERPEPSWADRALWLAGAGLLAATLVLVGIEHYWLRDLKFDDAYIHFRYARNLAQGKGFVYNEGERVLGSGAIPWNLLLAAVAAVTPADTLPVAVSILNYLALLACAAVVVAAVGRDGRRWLGMLIAAALLAEGPLVVSSIGGMETVILCLLYFLVFLALLRERYELAGLAAGIAVCFRVESVFLALAAIAAPALYARRRFWRTLAATLLVPLVVHCWAWLYFGFPLANSTLAKRIVYDPPALDACWRCLKTLQDGLQFARLWPRGPIAVAWAQDARVVLWLPFLCLGFLFVRRSAPAAGLVLLQPLGAFAFYARANPLMFPWYDCTYAPLATLFALLGVAWLGERVPGPRAVGAAATLVAMVWLSCTPVLRTWWPLAPPTDARFSFSLPNADAHSRVYQYVNIARFLDSRVRPDEIVCAAEIGALGYYHHGRILDAIGLVSPEALRYHPNPLRRGPLLGAIPPRLVRDLRPEYVVAMDLFAEYVWADPWFGQNYVLIGRWPWFGGPVRWHDLPTLVWTGYEMRAYRRVDVP